jgi:beta-galactosidase
MVGTESGQIFQSFDERYSLGDDSAVVRPNYTSGMLQAERRWKGCTPRPTTCTWDVPYEPGVLRAVGRRRDRQPCATDEVRTAGAPAAVRLVADRDTITAAPGDVAHVSFEIVDSAGTVVPTADNVVRFSVTGGSILALDNADLQDHDPYGSDRRRAFNGRGLAYLRAAQPGALRVTAAADGLLSASVTIQVRPGEAPPAIPAAR